MNEAYINPPKSNRPITIAALSLFCTRAFIELLCGYLYQHHIASIGSIVSGTLIALIPAAVSTAIVAYVRLPVLLSCLLLTPVLLLHLGSISQSLRYAAHGKISEDWGPLIVFG